MEAKIEIKSIIEKMEVGDVQSFAIGVLSLCGITNNRPPRPPIFSDRYSGHTIQLLRLCEVYHDLAPQSLGWSSVSPSGKGVAFKG